MATVAFRFTDLSFLVGLTSSRTIVGFRIIEWELNFCFVVFISKLVNLLLVSYFSVQIKV